MDKFMEENTTTHRTPNFAGWGGLDGLDLSKDIEVLDKIEHDIDKLKETLYHEKRVLNHAYHHEEETEEDRNNIIQKELYHLHQRLMDLVITFCRVNHIDADAVSFGADALECSITCGKWHAGTDSALTLYDNEGTTLYQSI